jgi:hypothetical protein
MEDEYRIHRALVEEMEKTTLNASGKEEEESPSGTSQKEKDRESEEDGFSGMENVPLSRGRTPSQDPSEAGGAPHARSASQNSQGKRSLDMNRLFKDVPKKADGSSSTDNAVKKGKAPNPRLPNHRISFSFKNKRLCEKWLDNLFMVLYNDLRLYTALKQEIGQYRSTSSANSNVLLYRKTGAEWEIYGTLSERLLHRDDAKEAYKLCLTQKMSFKSWLRLLEIYSDEGDIRETLLAAIKLSHVTDRTYQEITFPSPIARCLFKLIRKHGLAKVMNVLISLNTPPASYKLITRYFEYAELFKVMGYNW